ncbi:hypothetical protein JOE40_001726 [Arthrobacter sp. PvP102]|nr:MULTISPECIES: hypothetical protein [unclassified Arthrobacter]MBP1232082.1 hypothetical protein [Arthrobacter sp. PvP103]MBP1237217.1 hypothetical protein [Arthrobacter sp. PvP102]
MRIHSPEPGFGASRPGGLRNVEILAVGPRSGAAIPAASSP